MDILKLEDSAFVFNSYQSDVRIDVSVGSRRNQNTINSYKITAEESQPLKFAYEYGEGLVEIKKINSKRTSNILGSLLKINYDDVNGYINFVSDYGFLFPIDFDRVLKIEPSFFGKYSERLMALVELINQVGDSSTADCRKIMELSLYLLFDDGWHVKVQDKEISSYEYELAKLIDDPYDLPERISKQESVNKRSYTIEDSIYSTFEFSSDEYNEIMNGTSSHIGWDDFRFKSLVYLYANNHIENSKEKGIIDLIFHWYKRVGIPQIITADGIKYYSHYNESGFDEYNLFDSIIDFGKYIINHEINNGIKDIRPECDLDTMKSKWIIPSLSSALYFSLFYLDKEKEMMRKCQYCGGYFIVKRSSDTKIYCGKYCRNNSQQLKHRLKVRTK